jgi:hypothetical protein
MFFFGPWTSYRKKASSHEQEQQLLAYGNQIEFDTIIFQLSNKNPGGRDAYTTIASPPNSLRNYSL